MNVQQADLIISSVIMTPERFRYLDFPHPWMEEAAVLVIPAPDSSTNISSIWQPFQLTVSYIFYREIHSEVKTLIRTGLGPHFCIDYSDHSCSLLNNFSNSHFYVRR